MRKISEKGLALIKSFEGLRLDAYRDAVGIWTIGYGHTSAAGDPPVKSGDRITAQRAHDILAADVARVVAQMYAVTPRDALDRLPQDAFDAVTSFCFNVGIGNYRWGSSKAAAKKTGAGSVWSGVCASNPSLIATGLRKYVMAGGKRLPGLVKRRVIEARLVTDAMWAAPLPAPPDVPAPEPLPLPPDTPPSAPAAPAGGLTGGLAVAWGVILIIASIIGYIFAAGAGGSP